MKNKIITVVIILLAFLSHAQVADKKLTKEEHRAEFEKKYYLNTGGRVVKPNSGEGKIVIYNAQKIIDCNVVKSAIDNMMIYLAINIEQFNKVEKMDLQRIADITKTTEGATTIFLVDSDQYPLSLVAYENGYGIVNCRFFKSGISEKVTAARFEKELLRTLALTSGISFGMGTSTLMLPVRSPEALDNCQLPNERGNPMISGPIQKYLMNFGVTPLTVSTYRKACMEGWAPAPKDDAQRALMENARKKKEKGPVNAIKILPKKGN